jgi:hypothetical protein
MNRYRILLFAALALALLAAAIFWPSGRKPGFATPDACLEAYRDAYLAGDLDRYLSCLGEPLRSEKQRAAGQLAEELRQESDGVSSWVRHETTIDGATAQVEVEEVRRRGNRRVRFHFERFDDGWLIVGIHPSPQKPAAIPYGTRVGEEPSGK